MGFSEPGGRACLRRTPPATGKGGGGSGRCNQQKKKWCCISPFQVGLWATCPREPWWAQGPHTQAWTGGSRGPAVNYLNKNCASKNSPCRKCSLWALECSTDRSSTCWPGASLGSWPRPLSHSAASLTVSSRAPSSSVTSPPPGQEVLASPCQRRAPHGLTPHDS